MSRIYTALRALESDQSGREKDAIHANALSAASAVNADDFSVLKEFTGQGTSSDEPREEQSDVNRSHADYPALVLSADDFSALEGRIVRVVELVQQERENRMAAEERALLAEAQTSELAERVQALEREMSALRNESSTQRERVGQMMALLDTIEL